MELSTVQKQLETRDKELRGLQDLLDVRTRELQDARTFLDTADLVSGEDIISMAEALNAEIFQTAAYMADSSVFGVKCRLVDTGEVDPWLGADFVEILRSGKNTEARVQCVQIALQASLVRSCMATIAMWHPDPKIDEGLRQLYSKIQKTEKQAIAGKWRALTQKAIEPPSKHDEAEIQTVLEETLANILTMAGYDPGDNKLAETLLGSGIAKKLVELRFCARQGVTSCEMEPVYIAPGLLFNSEAMEDALSRGDLKQQDGEMQICSTTELGLAAIEGWGLEEPESSLKFLKKAKVILLSGLNDIVA
ncbi:hypothetical protein IW262DRAFT_1281438 [Armillaria fumosa]|nr:hypothetical protein IW262DRAFT_1281438 [Armillaria fumosa]